MSAIAWHDGAIVRLADTCYDTCLKKTKETDAVSAEQLFQLRGAKLLSLPVRLCLEPLNRRRRHKIFFIDSIVAFSESSLYSMDGYHYMFSLPFA